MSHTWTHVETGIRIRYNGDHTGNSTIAIPAEEGGCTVGEDGMIEVVLPGFVLAQFGRAATLREVMDAIEELE